MSKTKSFTVLLCILLTCRVTAQINPSLLFPDYRPAVTVNGNQLAFPWTGGLNSPVFSSIDVNGDNANDIIAFDRVGNRLSVFVNDGITGNASYHFAPEYNPRFPEMHDWVRTADMDCDGDMDLFSFGDNTIIVYRNDYNISTGLVFNLVTTGLTANGTGIYVSQVNMPAIADADGDDDLDILSFSSSSNYVEYFENYSMDSTGVCDNFNYYLDPNCWGFFKLSGLANTGILNDNCGSAHRVENNRHSGSVLTAIDQDCDGDADLINGDILGENLLYLHNSGSPDSAYVDQQDTVFPHYDTPLDMQNLPAAYYFDVDNDGVKDMLVSPFATVGEDFNNVWFYHNAGDNCNNIFNLTSQSFLRDEMIDVGTAANVSFFDVNNDGLQDIIAGNDLYYNADPLLSVSKLAYFQNTGTATAPAFNLITNDWLNLSTFQQSALSPTFGDIDGDGDDDLLIGNTNGVLLLFINTAGSGNVPAFSFASPSYQNIDVGNNSSPQIIDVNRDGKKDLLIGERTGNLDYFENTGTSTVPVYTLTTSSFGGVNVLKPGAIAGYSRPLLYDSSGIYRLIVGSESGNIYSYTNIDGNLTGQFTLEDTLYDNITELKRVTVAMTDIDGDGYPDLLTGCNAGGMRLYTHHVPTSLSEVKESSFKLSGNPSNQSFSVNFNSEGLRNIIIFDLEGRVVRQIQSTARLLTISTDNLTAGLYLIQVLDKDRTYSGKVVVQH